VRRSSPSRACLLLSFLVSAGGLLPACPDPCVSLAERICNCEPLAFDRVNCRRERITGQQSRVPIDDADREICEQKLETCTCAALDRNDLDACGFAPPSEGEGEGE
jgi:hypothetical protein